MGYQLRGRKVVSPVVQQGPTCAQRLPKFFVLRGSPSISLCFRSVADRPTWQGGPSWNLTYTAANSTSNAANTKVVVIRTGFSTHCVSVSPKNIILANLFCLTDEFRATISRTCNFVC